jgi:hypothetical protein
VNIASQPLGIRVRTRQLLDGEIAKVTEGNQKAATQVETALRSKTAPAESQRGLQHLIASTNVSLFHRFIYWFLSLCSSSYRQRTEMTAESYYQFLRDNVRKDLSTMANQLADLCDELFTLNPDYAFPATLTDPYEGPILVRNPYEVIEKCIVARATNAEIWNRILLGPSPWQECAVVFRQWIQPPPLHFLQLKGDITESNPKLQAFIAKVVQYSEVLDSKKKLKDLHAEMIGYCSTTLISEVQIYEADEIKKCCDKFVKTLTNALNQSPLKKLFSAVANGHNLDTLKWDIYAYFLSEFLQFADTSSTPNGSRFAFFNSAIDAEKFLSSMEITTIGQLGNYLGIQSADSNTPLSEENAAMEKFSNLIGEFRENLKTCLLSEKVKFKPFSGTQEMTFREHFVAAANG